MSLASWIDGSSEVVAIRLLCSAWLSFTSNGVAMDFQAALYHRSTCAHDTVHILLACVGCCIVRGVDA